MKCALWMSKLAVFSLALLITGKAASQPANLSAAAIISSSAIGSPFKETLTTVLQEEIFQRTKLSLQITSKWPSTPAIALALEKDAGINGISLPVDSGVHIKAEGYRIVMTKSQGRPVVWLIGADERGLLFSVGAFLTRASFSAKKILFDKSMEGGSSPVYSIRGHQLGYRNTANSWDAWTPEQYDKYIRELALLGSNCIENIPFQGGTAGPLMKVSRQAMNIRMSEICRKYAMDYWVWTPVDVDLSDTAKFKAEVEKHLQFYKECPKLDNVFVPGGDPGENDPEYVMPFLKQIAAELKVYHPNAGVWLSLQGFNERQVDYFYEYLQKNNPDWLRGVVSGPGSPGVAPTRYRLPAKYRHRDYPDLTHNVRCQYPVQNWDQAFALTEGREVCNPRPFFYAAVHRRMASFTDGFICYSDGVHDDVNKAVWTQLAWDPEKDLHQIIRDYAGFFFGSSVAEEAATGIFALERNWAGPVQENGGIETTFSLWKNLEDHHPELANNWRWQLLVMRSYYDTYTARRERYEKNLERQANLIIEKVAAIGSEKAMEQALLIVNKADGDRVYPELRTKIVDYCASLFKTVGLQTSMEKYQASGEERGAILDFIDYPLNNRWWLADEFEKVRKLKSEPEKLARLKVIGSWEKPGWGSYYDNVSNIAQQPHVKTRSDDGTDVAWWDNGKSRRRLSTQLFQNFPQLEYEDLDPAGHYLIRIAGEGEALLRVDGERVAPTFYNKEIELFKEFPIASKYVIDGKLVISFDQPEESTLNWRKKSKVCDVWLIKK